MKAVTANRLIDGQVVYRDRAGRWIADIAQAFVFPAEREPVHLDQARADEVACIIVAPYTIDVTDMPHPEPVTLREQIRARGPTVENRAEKNGDTAHADAHVQI